jgi:hypothetical protein
MPKPSSYPFLAIAKKYETPYEGVLADAAWYRTIKNGPLHNAYWREIAHATAEFKAIQSGKIDWITGEPIS